MKIPVEKRAPLFTSYDKSVHEFGHIAATEWQDEVSFLGLEGKVKNLSAFYTNDLIEEINKFDHDAIIRQAKTFTIPTGR